jgi:cytoskeletal protein RodZ
MNELGTRLVRAREARGLTLEDAERDTRISRRYLQALEAEQFEAIPAPVYARGFLRSYSQYLGLNAQEMLDLFPRDEDEPPSYQRDVTQRASPENPISATSLSRPTWRRPQPPRQAAQQQRRETVGRQRRPQPRTQDDYRPREDDRSRDEYDDYDEDDYQPRRPRQVRPSEPPRRADPRQSSRRQDESREPMIGVDIGVPAPARRIKTDPAAQTRTLAVVAVAVGAIIVVIVVAFLLSRAGGSAAGVADSSPTVTTAGSLPGVGGAESTATATIVAGTPVKVPDVLNLQQSEAENAIRNAGLQVSLLDQSATQPKGTIIDQAPAPGSDAVAGDTVHLVVSSGQ